MSAQGAVPAGGPAIAVAGEALFDLVSGGGPALTAIPGGSPYNTARAIARLGVSCAWIGSLSDDRFGRALEATLVMDGVDLRHVQRTSMPTTLAVAELDPSGAASYRFYVDGTAGPALYQAPLQDGLPRGTCALLVGSLGLVLEPMASTVEELVLSLGPEVILMVDPNARPSIVRDQQRWRARLERILGRADIVKASADDLSALRPGAAADDTARWLASLGPSAVIVTDGPGAVLVECGGQHRELTPDAVAVVDTIGAGDTFSGALLAFLVATGTGRHDLSDVALVTQAVMFALRASAEVCQRHGADPPTLAELGGWPIVSRTTSR